ncbi:hypothetical protein A2483_02765 [Candidatus Peregrinibacteria bacterium RIFOXYC2_FULL_33_13]|nr:MAG: hypothetical protein A2229_02595 [Candidatus Peregrinibacteria bacterium RIFOXYA2_FULL_33_7]OGJ52054.1 MAG: hypothetical protein A2483_02765 [Candidatus Peregrinibacteria bacterium RIFOXYC2_FULL_33_13]
MKPFDSNLLRVIPLGGLDEVGKNMTIVEYGNDIIIIDMGIQFPEEDMLGIDFVIPDISYLKGKEHRIKGILITHGHLDHIGGIPYLIEKLNFPPIYATRLTIELIKKRNSEFRLKKPVQLKEINSNSKIKLGTIWAEFFRVNHSIPDCVGIILNTLKGILVFTGDFKFDLAPADNTQADIAKMGSMGSKNVLALFSDSTNALVPGKSISESKIVENLDGLINNAKGRVIIASFSSLLGRIQQIINIAVKYNRKIYVSGSSMESNIEIAKKLGYLKVPKGAVIHKMKKNGSHNENDTLILTTGSQGEEISSLTRMAKGEHAHIKIRHGDTVILSSSPIIGNERAISRVMNDLCKRGARVISNDIVDVHISGHAKQEDLKMMINLIKPKYLIPVHGELVMRIGHKDLGLKMGIKEENIIILNNGSILLADGQKAWIHKDQIETKYILVEGTGISSSAHQLLQDRQTLAKNGIIVVLLKIHNKRLIGKVDTISRGFIYREDTDKILEDIGEKAAFAFNTIITKDKDAKYIDIKRFVKVRLESHIHNITSKSPLIMPLIINL